MPRFLFDSDHLTHFQHGNSSVMARLALQPAGSVGLSPITMEEALRGRLASLSRPISDSVRIQAYDHLVETVLLFSEFPIIPFDQACENRFQYLRSLRLRVGTQDQKIAAVALAHNLTLLTGNAIDFCRVPGLHFDDWSV